MITDEHIQNAAHWVVGLFGPFDARVNINRIVLTEERAPFTVYPLPYSQFKVELHVPANPSEDWAIYRHLTHELVHCLTPNGIPSYQATVLEEGLAEHSAVYFLEGNFSYVNADGTLEDTAWRVWKNPKYQAAFELVERVVECEGLDSMRAGVTAMRADTGLPFSKITSDHMAEYFLKTNADILSQLGERFY